MESGGQRRHPDGWTSPARTPCGVRPR